MSGLKGYFARKQETTYGTAVVPTQATEITSETIEAAAEWAQSFQIRKGRMAPNADRRQRVSDAAAGNTPMEIPTKGFGWYLSMLKDGAIPAGVETPASSGAYKRVFLDGRPDWDQKSATLVVGRPLEGSSSIQAFTFPGSMLGGYTINVPAGAEFATFTPDWDIRDVRTDIAEPAALTYDADLGGFIIEQAEFLLDGVEPAALIKNASWTSQRPLDTAKRGFNTQGKKRKPTANGGWSGTLTAQAEFSDMTFVNAAREANRIHAVVITLKGVTEISAGVVPYIKAKICCGYSQAVSPKISSAEALVQDLNLAILDRDSVNAPIEYELLSAESTITT